jgi:transposase
MRLPPLELRDGDREVLEGWCRAGTVESRVAKRARIVLLAADGRSNRDIGELVDLHYNQVGVWRQRYREFGLAGLDDLERSGRPCVYDHDDLHCIVDNLSAHKTPLISQFLEANRQVHLHFTATHASWLNQVELFFSILERRLLRRGEFESVDHLAERIVAFIKDYNRRAKAFRWTYSGRPLMAA